MIFVIVWAPISCEFFDNETRAVLTEQALNADMDPNEPLGYGPIRVQTYEGENWDFTGETWSFDDVGYPSEAEAIAAWVLVMEPPVEEPPPE